MKCRIKWWTKNDDTISRICCRFNIDYNKTINDISEVEVDENDWDLFRETARRGFFSICSEPGS